LVVIRTRTLYFTE